MSDGVPLTNETEMLLQQELHRLRKIFVSLKEGLPKGFWDKKIDAEDEINEFDDKSIKSYGDAVKKAYGDDDTDYVKPSNYPASRDKKKVGESYNTLVNKIEKSGKSKKAAKAIAGAVASYKAKGGGKGPTAKQK